MKALILAAGMGRRLAEYTNNNTKCMVEVDGIKLIDRTIQSIKMANIREVVIVAGYKGENLEEYIRSKYKNDKDTRFTFIYNKDYEKTNNIYSLYLARDILINDDVVLFESDLIYEPQLIKRLIDDRRTNIALIAKYKSWMDGTVVTCDSNWHITEFIDKKNFDQSQKESYYKTVNIYKFSKEFSSELYVPYLEDFMRREGVNNYYETALKDVVLNNRGALEGLEIGNTKWYEIDNSHDLNIAESLFSAKNLEK